MFIFVIVNALESKILKLKKANKSPQKTRQDEEVESYVGEESDDGEEYEMEVESEYESESPYETETETATTETEESVDLGRSVDILHLKII